jgi:hypothetical protein
LKTTEYLSIYAAILSTGVFLWNMFKAIPKIKVDVVHAVHDDNGELKHGVYISTRNPSSHTVHLAGIDILYPYKKRKLKDLIVHLFKYRRIPRAMGWVHCSVSNYGIKDGCPLALEAGKSHNVFVSNELLEEILSDSTGREIKASVQDQLWRNKYSKEFSVIST